jgi:hypothetical protein
MAAETGGRGEGTSKRQARREMVWSSSTGKAYQLLVLDSRARDRGMRDGSLPVEEATTSWVCRRAPELDSQVLVAGQGDGITVRVRRVSRATFTRDPPSTHRAREVRWFKAASGGWEQILLTLICQVPGAMKKSPRARYQVRVGIDAPSPSSSRCSSQPSLSLLSSFSHPPAWASLLCLATFTFSIERMRSQHCYRGRSLELFSSSAPLLHLIERLELRRRTNLFAETPKRSRFYHLVIEHSINITFDLRGACLRHN